MEQQRQQRNTVGPNVFISSMNAVRSLMTSRPTRENKTLYIDTLFVVVSNPCHYSSGSQPFPTRGPLDKFCLGSRTTNKFLHFLEKICLFMTTFLKSFSLKKIIGLRNTKTNLTYFPNFLAFSWSM